jgi:two-component system, sensor histidine kinase and response regulator
MLFFSYVALGFIKSNYEIEKASSNEKTIAIEEQNVVLAKVNEEKNKLFSIVSHDLRSPLNTIQSYLELLSFDILEEKERKVAEKELVSLTKNTSDLLFNLLSWSKTQMEGVNAKLKPHNLFNVLAGTINTQHAIASQKDISFSNDIDKEAVTVCDEDMLQLVVRNLLNNAIKFTPSFGKISIHSKLSGNTVQLCISDSGKGIPEEQQKEIFSLKIQSTYGTNKEKGIGLGLVLCKEYIELQNGQIWFDSRPDVQTNFYISLPVA